MTAQGSSPAQGVTRERGFTLILALILLTVISLVVVIQVHRSTTDQRLAANLREQVSLDQSSETVLRWCEGMVIDTYRHGGTLNVIATPIGIAPAWVNAANFANGSPYFYSYPDTTAMDHIESEGCVVETLPIARSTVDISELPGGSASSGEIRFRVTARVVASDSSVSLLPSSHSDVLQSELRLVF